VSINSDSVPARSEGGERPGREGSGRTVLIVEDEMIIRELLSRVFRQAGYAVIEAGSPEDAFGAVRGQRHRVDLLVSDIGLPGSSGFEVFGELRRSNVGMRAVFISGSARESLPGVGELPAGAVFLEKPFESSTLLAAVRGLME